MQPPNPPPPPPHAPPPPPAKPPPPAAAPTSAAASAPAAADMMNVGTGRCADCFVEDIKRCEAYVGDLLFRQKDLLARSVARRRYERRRHGTRVACHGQGQSRSRAQHRYRFAKTLAPGRSLGVRHRDDLSELAAKIDRLRSIRQRLREQPIERPRVLPLMRPGALLWVRKTNSQY